MLIKVENICFKIVRIRGKNKKVGFNAVTFSEKLAKCYKNWMEAGRGKCIIAKFS